MEIIDEDDEEIKQLMLRISRKEITLCDSCDAFFDYTPQKISCDECMKAKRRERVRKYNARPEIKAKTREYLRVYNQRPERKAKKREYHQRPENKAKKREYMREYLQRKKKLREEEWFLLDEPQETFRLHC